MENKKPETSGAFALILGFLFVISACVLLGLKIFAGMPYLIESIVIFGIGSCLIYLWTIHTKLTFFSLKILELTKMISVYINQLSNLPKTSTQSIDIPMPKEINKLLKTVFGISPKEEEIPLEDLSLEELEFKLDEAIKVDNFEQAEQIKKEIEKRK